MEGRDIIRNVLVGLVALGVLVLLIVLIIRIFSGGGSTPRSNLDITDYTNTASSAVLMVDEPTNIDQEHRQVRITVSGSENRIEVFTGYQSTVEAVRTYANNPTAYGTFLQTLKLMGFAEGTKASADYRGYCPTGDRYLLSFEDGNTERFQYWTTSCNNIKGTFLGNKSGILEQFRLQIPEEDYDKLTQDVSMGF